MCKRHGAPPHKAPTATPPGEAMAPPGRPPYPNGSGRMRETAGPPARPAPKTAGTPDLARKPMETLSDGECQRAMIARALAQDTPVILLDEPTAFLDLPNRYALASLLRRLAHDEGRCLLFSTHDLDIALSLCDSVLLLSLIPLSAPPRPL